MAITIDLTGQVDGTYTIEDDGIPGNGTSVVRRPNATILTTFVHPADALTFISRTGQSIIFNVIDSLTTANLTIGSLTIPSQRADSVQIGGALTSGIVTLTANNTISEFGNDAATDIVAGTLLMDAGTGIGVFNAIETQVAVLEAESVTGGINISNIGNVTIGNATADLRGLFTGTSGDINLVNQGSITLNDSTGVEIVHSAGTLNLTAIGAASDIAAIANRDALFARGDMFLSAGRDVLFGRTGADFDNDVRAGGSIFITAGRDFIIDGFSDMAADDQGLASGGSITISVGRDILIDDANGVDASIGITAINSTGSIFLQTGIGGTFLLHANSSAAVQGRAGGVTVEADRVLIENDSGINVTSGGAATLTTRSFGREIILGSAVDGATAMGLSSAEIDRISAATLNIGSANAGMIQVAGAISPGGAPNLVLRSAFDILVLANVAATTSLNLVAGDNVVFSTVTLIVPTLSISIDQRGGDGGVGGQVDMSLVTTTATSVTITGSVDADTVVGSHVADTILGGGGNDLLDGGAGTDVLMGGLGNDTYIVDQGGDAVVEAAGGGTRDVIYALANYSLAAGSEVEVLSAASLGSTTPLVLVGNELGQEIYGNAGANFLTGGGGTDYLIGLGGDDTYFVAGPGDNVVEGAGGGTRDVITTPGDYIMIAGVEVEVLSSSNQAGTNAQLLIGNGFSQEIYGNAGANFLEGGGGADVLIGLAGDDTYVVDSADDYVGESAGGGRDVVYTSVSYTLGAGQEVEVLSTLNQAGTAAIDLAGNELSNEIYGNAGANVLNGGAGADVLQGFGGADSFAFTTALGGGNVDAILDFAAGTDKVALDDAIFTQLGGPGALAAGAFVTGAAAADADDRIIYNSATGQLFYDADGNGGGAAIQFATVQSGLALTASDFQVI